MTLRPIRRHALAAGIAMACALATGPPASAVVIVNGATHSWSPAIVRIAPGGRVGWRAIAGEHNVKAYGGNWSYFRTLPQGATRTRAFHSRGTFRFYCTLHATLAGGRCSGMCGKVVVR